HGFRPVWFNAWHHQRGEQLLASLYANIRAQAIPSILTPEGWDFRWDLFRIRARRYWIRLALTVLLIGFVCAYFWYHAESARFFLGMKDLTWEGILDRLKQVSIVGSGSLLAAILAPVIGATQALRAFGIDPKTLLGTIRTGKDGAVTAQPGVRY